MPTITKTYSTATVATTYQTAALTGVKGTVGGLPHFGLYIDGTAGSDTLYGTAYNDELHGRDGNDYLYGGAGNDNLFGENGNDYLNAGDGNDHVDGGAGNDYIMAGNGNDTFIGGAGYDTLDFSQTAAAGVLVDLTSGANTTGDTISGIENLVGTAGSDILNGNGGNNTLNGGASNDFLFGQGGNDTVIGGAGDDTIQGNAGNDRLTGGAGSDMLTGGDGADTFVLSPGSGPDRIRDFTHGVDKIELSGFGAHPLGNDGIIAYGEFGYQIGPGHYRLTHFSHVDTSDKLLYDYHTQNLYSVAPVAINGQIANYHAVLLAHIDYAPNSFQIGNGDFHIV